MNDLPLVTLGIPIYNAAELVEQTLLSALNQTYPNIEFLLIDDKGNSMDVVDRVLKNHSRRQAVRIIDQVYNQGVGAARNAVIDNASGEYLFTMDCDDMITADCIDILYNKMQEHPVDFVAASFVRIDLQGNKYPGVTYQDTLIEGEEYAVARYRYVQGREIFVASWNKLYKMDFLREHNIHCKVGHFNEDPWFTYQVIINASSCRLLPNCTLYYTYNPQSVSGISAVKGYSEKIAQQYVDIQKLKGAYIEFLRGADLYKALLVDIMSMSLYHAYRITMSQALSAEQKKRLQNDLLTSSFYFPCSRASDLYSIRYLFLCLFFKMPLSWKRWFVDVAVTIHFKESIRKWIHFKS